MKKNKIKSLIFGISGQDGSYLSRLLLSKKNEVYGTTRNNNKKNLKNLVRLGVLNKVKIIVYVHYIYCNNGDHAGSEASKGVIISLSLKPVRSMR